MRGLIRGATGLLACFWSARAHAFELPCAHEDALSETAAELVLAGERLRAEALLPAARRNGFDGVALQAHEGLDDAALIAWLKREGERSDAPLVCGEASSETRHLVLVSARGGALRQAGKVVRGQLAPGFSSPHLVLEDREGKADRLPVREAELVAGVALPEGRSFRRIQLVAEGPNGPRPVAELLFGRGREPLPAPPPTEEQQAAAAPERSSESLFGRILSFRRREGATGLRQNQLLGESAQKHAARVCELGRVAHRIGAGDDPETRLREEHIEARAVGEAVSRAASADAALSAIFDSPSHRIALTDRVFTDAGVGQASDGKGHTCLVVLLAAWPRRIP